MALKVILPDFFSSFIKIYLRETGKFGQTENLMVKIYLIKDK